MIINILIPISSQEFTDMLKKSKMLKVHVTHDENKRIISFQKGGEVKEFRHLFLQVFSNETKTCNQYFLAWTFYIPISEHAMVPQGNFSFVSRLMHVYLRGYVCIIKEKNSLKNITENKPYRFRRSICTPKLEQEHPRLFSWETPLQKRKNNHVLVQKPI